MAQRFFVLALLLVFLAPAALRAQDTPGAQPGTAARPDTATQAEPGQDADTGETTGRARSGGIPSLDEVARRRLGTSTPSPAPARGVQTPQAAQDGPARGGLPSLRDIADELSGAPVYIREVFRYPTDGRADPMTPPESITSPDAFPPLTLTGIVHDPDLPDSSVAILRLGTGPGMRRAVVRAGDALDNYRIVAVKSDCVELDVHPLGQIRRLLLKTQDGQTSKCDSQ